MLAVLAVAAPSAALATNATLAEREYPFDHEGAARVVPGLDVADPLAWSLDPASGLRFRPATALERDANAWPVGAFLVEIGDANRVEPAAQSASVLVPVGPASAVALVAPFLDSYVSAPIVAQPLDGEPTTSTPTITRYLAKPASFLDVANDDAILLYASDDGGYSGVGIVDGLTVQLVGPDPAWTLSLVGSPDRPVAGPFSLVIASPIDGTMDHCGFIPTILCNFIYDPQCSDGEDNDGDEWVDYPDDPGCSSSSDDDEFDARVSYNFGLFGEIKWGTANKANINSLLNQIGDEIDDGFDANGAVRANMVPIFYHYWYANSQADANTCANSGGCTDGSGHQYTFNACGSTATCYRNKAWNDVSHARQHSSFSGLHTAQVQHLGTQSDPGGSLCGLSRFHPGGDSVSIGRPYTTTGCKDYVATHEMGHSFDATHNNVLESGCGTVMAQSSAVSCRQNYFAHVNRAEVNDCIELSNCPRSGTG